MKTPRFFIALAACAVVFTIASSSFAPVLRSCSAESMAVLRVDPRMGDPDQPSPGYREIPIEEGYLELATTTTAPPAARIHFQSLRDTFALFLTFGAWRWRQ